MFSFYYTHYNDFPKISDNKTLNYESNKKKTEKKINVKRKTNKQKAKQKYTKQTNPKTKQQTQKLTKILNHMEYTLLDLMLSFRVIIDTNNFKNPLLQTTQ